MNPVLVDASAWIHYLRSGVGPLAVTLERLLDEGRAALCGHALTEVAQGLRPHQRHVARELFEVLPWIETRLSDFERAGEILANLRQGGITIPTIDGLIAAHCVERGMPLLESDRHFSHVENLDLYPWRDLGSRDEG